MGQCRGRIGPWALSVNLLRAKELTGPRRPLLGLRPRRRREPRPWGCYDRGAKQSFSFGLDESAHVHPGARKEWS